MEDKLIWSSEGNIEKLLSMSSEEKRNYIRDLVDDEDMVNSLSDEQVDEYIENLSDDESHYAVEDFDDSIRPMIEKQCKDGIVLMAGDVGRWDGNHRGGKALLPEDLIRFDFDKIEILSDENRDLVFKGSDHDGSTVMGLYSIPEEDDKLLEFVTECMDNAIQDDIYFNGTEREEAITDVMNRLDEIDYINDYCDFSKVSDHANKLHSNVGETVTEDLDESPEEKAERLTREYYNGKYDLDQLHRLLTYVFRSADKAYLWLTANDERIKNNPINEVKAKPDQAKGIKKELKEIKPLLDEYGYEYFTSMPFTNFDNDPTSFEYNYPQMARIVKEFFREMGLIEKEDLNNSDIVDDEWDMDFDKHDFDTVIKVAEIISNKPGKNKQFEKVFKDGQDDGLDDDQILAAREKEDDLDDFLDKEVDESFLVDDTITKEPEEEKLNEAGWDSEVYKVAEALDKYAREHNVFVDLVDYEDGPMNSMIIKYDIDGDWKHEHLYFDKLAEDFAAENGLSVFKIDVDTVGEPDSDYYEAIHTVYLIKKEDKEKFDSMRGMFQPVEEKLNEDAEEEPIDPEVDKEVEDDIGLDAAPEEAEVENPVFDAAEKVMAAYQNANKWLDSVKEFVYRDLSCVFFSSLIHELAHTMPGRFDKFGDILHTVDMKIPYPATEEIPNEPQNIDEVFGMIFNVLDGIKNSLNDFIKLADEPYHGMACAAEGLLNDIEGEYPMLFRLQKEWANCNGDMATFDKYVGQYNEHKDELLESLDDEKLLNRLYKGDPEQIKAAADEIEAAYEEDDTLPGHKSISQDKIDAIAKKHGLADESLEESGEDFFEPWDHDDDDNETIYLYSQDYDGTPESLEAIRKDLIDHYVYDEEDKAWVENIVNRIAAGDKGVKEELTEDEKNDKDFFPPNWPGGSNYEA